MFLDAWNLFFFTSPANTSCTHHFLKNHFLSFYLYKWFSQKVSVAGRLHIRGKQQQKTESFWLKLYLSAVTYWTMPFHIFAPLINLDLNLQFCTKASFSLLLGLYELNYLPRKSIIGWSEQIHFCIQQTMKLNVTWRVPLLDISTRVESTLLISELLNFNAKIRFLSNIGIHY